MKQAKIMGLTTRDSEMTFDKMMNAIGQSPSHLARSNDREDGENQDDEQTEQVPLTENDKPGSVMCPITNMVQQRLERFQQKQVMLDKLTPWGWEDAADCFYGRDKKYGTSRLMVAAVVQQHMVDDAAAPALTKCSERMEYLDIVRGVLQMPEGTSQPGTTHVKLHSVDSQLNISIPGQELATEPDSSPLLKAKLVEPESFYPCI
jgi:hypothetical protein